MKQIGILPGSSIFGDDPHTYASLRDKRGELKSRVIKAVSWYAEQRSLKAKATGAFPYIYFSDVNGNEEKAHIEQILAEYEQSRRHRAPAS